MGVIKSGIQGGFSGKVGSHVGSFWKGIAVMRKMPDSVANPNTIGQQTQRSKFKAISSLASSLLVGIVKPLWDRQAVRMSGYNLFVKTNIKAVEEGGIFDFEKLVISKGRIDATPIDVFSTYENENIDFQWGKEEIPTYGSPDDGAYIVVLDNQGNVLDSVSGTVTRSTGGLSLTKGNYGAIEDCHCYLAFMSPDKKYISKTAYLRLPPSA